MLKFAYGDGVPLHGDLRPKDLPKMLASARQRAQGRGIELGLTASVAIPAALARAAADAVGSSSDVVLYLTGDAEGLAPERVLPFRGMQHLNLNASNMSDLSYLEEFTELRSLVIQGHSKRVVDLSFLRRMPKLVELSIPAHVQSTDALQACSSLTYLSCSSTSSILQGITNHPTLRYLDISFGTCTDLSAVSTVPSLRGLALYQVRGLRGDDLAPLGTCPQLTALSLGALRNVTHLPLLQGKPGATLQAVLIEALPALESLDDVAACGALTQLGIYDGRPVDKSLRPLRRLRRLAHLVLGAVYPRSEVEDLLSWYEGSLHYRNKITRGEFMPRWRTPIEALALALPAANKCRWPSGIRP